MSAVTDSVATAASGWLAGFEAALARRDAARLRELLLPDCHWRDVLALTWRIRTLSGRDAVVEALCRHAAEARMSGFELSPGRTAPRHAMRAGRRCIEAIFRFETRLGRGSGVLRLLPDGEPRAWTLLTSLDEIKGDEEQVGRRRPTGQYVDRQPTVLVVGGGHAGLSAAARLTRLGIDTLIVDRWPRVGDNWRRRYDALKLHNQMHVNHLPYLPFPPGWPVYIPKDKLASWFESYAKAMELDYWTGSEFEGGRYDQAAKRWSATVRLPDGAKRELHPRHIVLATGVSGIPNVPAIPALEGFRGRVIHSHEYQDGEPWRGKRVLVVGTGTSGHDIAQDLHSRGAQVTIVQRSPTLIIQCDPSAQLVYGLYSEGPPLEDCDLITASVPLPLAKKTHQLATAHAKSLDQPLLEALERKGFRLTDGEEGTGWQFMYLTKGGGYYFNVGCSDLIVDGSIALEQISRLPDLLPSADLVVLATGYKGQEALVAKLFGEETAQRVGPVWGFGADQELRNMFQRTPQPGLWFIAGSFAQCRIYSKCLALQIKASEIGIL